MLYFQRQTNRELPCCLLAHCSDFNCSYSRQFKSKVLQSHRRQTATLVFFFIDACSWHSVTFIGVSIFYSSFQMHNLCIQCESIETACQQKHYSAIVVTCFYPVTQRKSNISIKLAQAVFSQACCCKILCFIGRC